ncbi:hypothetical protein A2U01_0052477, partial [Trifolium medium]|nr:hypothetical protein [Trifolium medium]
MAMAKAMEFASQLTTIKCHQHETLRFHHRRAKLEKKTQEG